MVSKGSRISTTIHFLRLQLFLNPDSLKEAELDAMAEADALIAREDSTGESQPLR